MKTCYKQLVVVTGFCFSDFGGAVTLRDSLRAL